ncbi:MAG: M48 family metalloprotease [Alphaproteobacteria bacterium]
MLNKIFIILFFLIFCANANAQVVIEDEETETYLYELIKPIYKTAGIPFDKSKIHILLDDNINAFVTDGSNLFIHTGLITRAKNSNELSGVFAHEAGHIKAGHIFKQKIKDQEMQKVSLASMILAGVAGAASGSGEVAVAGIFGTQGALMGKYFEYRKEDERSADNFALGILKENNIPNEDLLNFLTRLQQDNQLQGITETSYYSTHPLTQERISFLENQKTTGEKKYDTRLKTIQAKLDAFVSKPSDAIKKYYNKNNYATAIALFKGLKIDEAMKYVDALIKQEPNNPYYHELKAQILFETAKPKQSAIEYEKALKLLPTSTYYKTYLASSLIEGYDEKEKNQKAVELLKQANIENKTASNFLLLARAYGKLNDNANALLASAEYSLLLGRNKVAKKQAEQAKELSNNPVLILQADDIIGSIKDKEKPLRKNRRG